jgi:hypothetical protein
MERLEAFFGTASEFCRWAEVRPATPDDEVATALSLLSRLYAQALELPPLFDEEDAPKVSHEEWLVIYKRFGSLPFNYYAEYSEPHCTEDPSPGMGDLADDLADIWRDLKGGLALYNKGNHAAAAWERRESFNIHWARHAAGALYALQCWRS